MHQALIIASYTVFVSFTFSCARHIPEKLKNQIQIDKNATSEKTALEESNRMNRNKLGDSMKKDLLIKKVSNSSEVEISNKTAKAMNSKFENFLRYQKALESLPILQKIHARITRSKDAVWATITLTFICVLLVLAVAQSRMWKDHYYRESQGVPLPNINERVLFKGLVILINKCTIFH